MGELQKELFRPEDYPECPAAVEAVKRYAVTGKIAFQDEDRLLSIVQDLLARQGVKTIARRYSMGPKTIRLIRDALEENGKLAPYKERAREGLKHFNESCIEELQDRIDHRPDSVPDNILLLGTGISQDKIHDLEDRAAGMGVVRGNEDVKGGNAAAASLAERIRNAKQAIVDVDPVDTSEGGAQ